MPGPAIRLDWDGLLTLGLTLLVCLATLGGAYLLWLYRVTRIARRARHRPEPTEWLVVPGKRLVDDAPDADFRRRLEQAARLYRPRATRGILLLGGTTAHAGISEAQAGRGYLELLAWSESPQILLEHESRNTLTNLRNLRELLRETQDPDPGMTLISNRYHLPRLGLIAASLGIRHRLAAAEPVFTPSPAVLWHLAREALFCLWFSVGKRWAAMTGNARMLARVT